jgi:hypothetical protein
LCSIVRSFSIKEIVFYKKKLFGVLFFLFQIYFILLFFNGKVFDEKARKSFIKINKLEYFISKKKKMDKDLKKIKKRRT